MRIKCNLPPICRSRRKLLLYQGLRNSSRPIVAFRHRRRTAALRRLPDHKSIRRLMLWMKLDEVLEPRHGACSNGDTNPGATSMSNSSRVVKANPEELPADLIDLGTILSRLPAEHRDQVEPIFIRVVESTKRRRRILSLVQDALSQLRLDMKYLMFDLEATRRERDDFRRKVEET